MMINRRWVNCEAIIHWQLSPCAPADIDRVMQSAAVQEIAERTGLPVVVTGPGDTISSLTVEQMRELGWERADVVWRQDDRIAGLLKLLRDQQKPDDGTGEADDARRQATRWYQQFLSVYEQLQEVHGESEQLVERLVATEEQLSNTARSVKHKRDEIRALCRQVDELKRRPHVLERYRLRRELRKARSALQRAIHRGQQAEAALAAHSQAGGTP